MRRAGQRLMNATTSAEVLEAKQLAELALHYAKVTQAANETQADCLRMIVRAEMCMADEIDRKPSAQGQRRDLNFVQASDEVAPTFEDLGIPRQRVSEWRATRDAGQDAVEAAIEGALAEGRAPTKADIKRHVHVSANSGNNEWYTPPEILEAARRALGDFDLDPASSAIANRTVRASRFFTAEDDALSQPWPTGRIWMNPPYSRDLLSAFIDRFLDAVSRGSSGIVLVNNATETGWFQRLIGGSDAVCFTAGRIKYLTPAGRPENAPLQGQAMIYFGQDRRRFASEMAPFGTVMFRGDADA